MDFVLLFPGQGSQKVGMGLDLYQNNQAARAIWDRADSLLGFSLTRLAFEGPEDSLKLTKNAQLALYVSEAAALAALLDSGLRPKASAGHSIGEYAALLAAGCIRFEDGLMLVEARGSAMNDAASANPGTMAAIMGLDISGVQQAVQAGSAAGIVGIANFNSAEQIVISGESGAVEVASEAAKSAGAKRVVPLAVSGGFHSPLMKTAADQLAESLDKVNFNDPVIPVILNVTAKQASSGDEVKKLLKEQVTSQVRWHETMLTLLNMGCTNFIEAGPGKVLSGMARRYDGAGEVLGLDSAEDLTNIITAWGQA